MTAELDARTGSNAVTTAASYAPLLLDGDEAAAARWRTLDDSDLDAEIERYRAALQALQNELNGGVAARPDGAASGKACSHQRFLYGHTSKAGHWCGLGSLASRHGGLRASVMCCAAAAVEPLASTADEEAQEAQIGSLDDVDPAEWQVLSGCRPHVRAIAGLVL